MAITINGNGTIGGITAGGLPNGTVTRDDLETNAKGSILQIAQDIDDGENSTNSSTFVDSGLILASFPNPIQSTSKVYATINLIFSETYAGSWAHPHYFTLFQGTDVANGANIGDATRGMSAGNAIEGADGEQTNRFSMMNLTASLLHTPTNTNPYYRLFYRTHSTNHSVFIGSAADDSDVYNVGRTIVTIMEVAQ
jgi:hypothetical protein